MRRLYLSLALLLTSCGEAAIPTDTAPVEISQIKPVQAEEGALAAPASFDTIADEKQRSAALFAEMFKVISHPRCMNCHPAGGPITQGEDMVPHSPMVTRGPDDFGEPGMKCSTCHGPDNVTFSISDDSIPGHDPWHVAPLSMGWQGKTITQICEQLKDSERNGGRTLEEILKHNAEDGLVGWGWHPGDGREPAPGSQKEFGELTAAWIKTGAYCPA